MTFLPIVERELRVAARRKGTYWSRIGASGLAVFILAAMLIIFEMGRGMFGAGGQLGTILFEIFSWLSFAFVCASGVFLTADSLSEEKREGTLGLLFLTDLQGYDVVLGKLVSHSLVAAYGLLAAFPVVGIAFLIGGVTGAEFWRLMLVLFNTLFFSLAVGMWVSALSRDAQRAMSGAAFVCALFLIVFPLIDWAMADWDATKFTARFSLFSAGFGLSEARSARLQDFWMSLVLVHGTGWVFLVAASVLAPRRWQEASAKATEGAGSRAQRWRFGGPAKRRALRLRWLLENPVQWLAGRDLWTGRFLWFALAVCLVGAALLSVSSGIRVMISVGNGATGLYMMLLNLWVAAYATRFFVDAMRTGTLELLLVTPLAPKQIVLGQWRAIWRTFLIPIIVLLLLEASFSYLQLEENIRMNLKNNPTLQADAQWLVDMRFHHVINSVSSLLLSLSGFVAVAWFGMWMGLNTRKANYAVIKTLVYVQVLPFIAFIFAMFGLQAFLSLAGGFNGFWTAQIIATIGSLALDVAFIVFARRRLLSQLREVAVQSSGEDEGGGFRWPKFKRRSGTTPDPSVG